MRRPIYKRFLPLVLLALVLGGCNVETDRSGKPGPDWSRGLYLGQASLRQPVALAVDVAGGSHLAWYGEALHYAHLDREAHVLRNEALPVETPLPRRPQLLLDGEGRIHLAWLSRQGDIQRLYHRVLYPPEAVGPTLLLSQEGEDVSSYTMYRAADGRVSFLWASEGAAGEQGLVHVRLDAPADRVTLTQEGLDPFAVVDRAGVVHVAWFRQRALTAYDVYYATLQEDTSGAALAPAGGLKLTDFAVTEGAILHGPLIGLDAGTLYVMWAEQNVGGGLTPTSAFSYYIAFPTGSPAAAHARRIGLPPSARPDYEDVRSPYGFSVLDPLSPEDVAYGSDFVSAPAAASTQLDELAVAYSLMTESEATREIQIVTAVFSGGEPVGYQLASETSNASLVPSIAADAQDGLHLAWIDTAGFGDYGVYYASTALDARRWLDRTTTDDLVQGAARALFGVLSGVGLLPIAGIWSFPAVVWVVVFFIATGKEDMDRRATQIGFAVAVLIYAGIKTLLMPGLFAGTPFLQQVPAGWKTPLGTAVPLLILASALLAVYRYLRRAQRATIFKAVLILAGVDVALTLLLYAPGFFGGI
jgi:hypothetical protein